MIVEFLDKGAIQRVDLDIPRFYSHLLFAQKNEQWRSILSLKIETVQSVRDLLKIWGVGGIYRSAYLHFLFDGKTYEFRVLPFGPAMSPHMFTRELKQ